MTGHGAGDHGGIALGDEETEHSPGPDHAAQRRQRGDGVVDDLEDAVAQHQVGAVGADHVEQAGQVALATGDRDVVLAGTAVEGGQGVGAGVDHGDPVAEPADPDGQTAGPAADVEDVERVAAQHRLQRGPHDGGTGVAASLARWAWAPA